VSKMSDFWLQKVLASPKLQQRGTWLMRMKITATTKTSMTMLMIMTTMTTVPVVMMTVGQRLCHCVHHVAVIFAIATSVDHMLLSIIV